MGLDTGLINCLIIPIMSLVVLAFTKGHYRVCVIKDKFNSLTLLKQYERCTKDQDKYFLKTATLTTRPEMCKQSFAIYTGNIQRK